MKKKRLVTSALPYVNNIPHLGNLLQVLSADVFARYCRLNGYETLYICGTDEYGTATETRALEEGVTPKELCDRYHRIHADIYDWFNIQFDNFGRTSTEKQTEITQGLFLKLEEAGYINEKTIEQLYSEKSSMFLADRYVRGTCPECGYEEARGDQCENCGKLLDPTDLIDPRSGIDGSVPVLKKTKHLYIDLPGILPKLEQWIGEVSVRGFWARNAVQMTKSWIRDGLKERCITRDLSWGIPVPKDGFRNKVFYVWFDAPIGYISITANHTDEWEDWWKNPEEVELFQFIGKDNIPFHTVVFPSTLLGSGENWTMLHHMSSSEYLNYESGKFSKSKGIGVFGSDAKETGIPADVWRFYLFYNRPEKSDAVFTWKDFQEKVNSELIGNLGNLVNRTLSFVHRFYDGKIPEGGSDPEFWEKVKEMEGEITKHLDRAELRDAFRKIFALADMGNKFFQAGEPWKTRTSEPEAAARLLRDLTYLVRDLGILLSPFIPAAEVIGKWLRTGKLSWKDLGSLTGIAHIEKPEILFKRLEDKEIKTFKERFAGSQKERKEKEQVIKEEVPLEQLFSEKIDLRAAKITAIERHPEADKLYIETVNLGGEERQIVSGLVPYYKEDELIDRTIILVRNLKSAKLRGIKSEGMLLAVEGNDSLEVLFVDNAEPGTPLLIKEAEPVEPRERKRITIDKFFEIPLRVEDHILKVGDTEIHVSGKPVRTNKVRNGEVG